MVVGIDVPVIPAAAGSVRHGAGAAAELDPVFGMPAPGTDTVAEDESSHSKKYLDDATEGILRRTRVTYSDGAPMVDAGGEDSKEKEEYYAEVEAPSRPTDNEVYAKAKAKAVIWSGKVSPSRAAGLWKFGTILMSYDVEMCGSWYRHLKSVFGKVTADLFMRHNALNRDLFMAKSRLKGLVQMSSDWEYSLGLGSALHQILEARYEAALANRLSAPKLDYSGILLLGDTELVDDISSLNKELVLNDQRLDASVAAAWFERHQHKVAEASLSEEAEKAVKAVDAAGAAGLDAAAEASSNAALQALLRCPSPVLMPEYLSPSKSSGSEGLMGGICHTPGVEDYGFSSASRSWGSGLFQDSMYVVDEEELMAIFAGSVGSPECKTIGLSGPKRSTKGNVPAPDDEAAGPSRQMKVGAAAKGPSTAPIVGQGSQAAPVSGGSNAPLSMT